jgi:hypothetical protein
MFFEVTGFDAFFVSVLGGLCSLDEDAIGACSKVEDFILEVDGLIVFTSNFFLTVFLEMFL